MPHKFVSYREDSKSNYGKFVDEAMGESPNLSLDQVKIGPLLRSADALEAITKTLEAINKILINQNGALGGIRWNVSEIADRPTKEKREIARLKRLNKIQRQEIKKLQEKNHGNESENHQ